MFTCLCVLFVLLLLLLLTGLLLLLCCCGGGCCFNGCRCCESPCLSMRFFPLDESNQPFATVTQWGERLLGATCEELENLLELWGQRRRCSIGCGEAAGDIIPRGLGIGEVSLATCDGGGLLVEFGLCFSDHSPELVLFGPLVVQSSLELLDLLLGVPDLLMCGLCLSLFSGHSGDFGLVVAKLRGICWDAGLATSVAA